MCCVYEKFTTISGSRLGANVMIEYTTRFTKYAMFVYVASTPWPETDA